MDRQEANREVARLRQEIRHHDHLYYVRDEPRISDAAYDRLYHRLKDLEETFPELVTPDSPTQRVGGAPLDGFPAVDHAAPMLSLDSDQDEAALQRFDERLRKGLEGAAVAYTIEPKLDGASLEVVYRDGLLSGAATRGDGRRGEGITENARTIRSLPLRLQSDRRPIPPFLSLRGEVIMRIEEFDKLNERLVAAGRDPFANPRNVAAGALRQLDPRDTAAKPLDIYVYDILAVDWGDHAEQAPTRQWEVFERLRDWGLPVSSLSSRGETVEDILAYHADLDTRRDDLGFEIDGIVIKLDDLAARETLGTTSRHPRWAFAFKFPPRREITRLMQILPSVGRTGVVTPVAMLRPVELSGVTVSRATLHNREELARKDVREGDRVRIQRAGDVIPQVLEVIPEPDRERAAPWAMPERCPSCDTPLIDKGPFVLCPNSFECPAQLEGRLIHFASRDALDIEGLGEKSVRLFVAEKLVTNLPDIFDLEARPLMSLEGFGKKSATDLVAAIATASNAELHRFLYGLGIPEVGVTTARDLARHFGTFEALRQADDAALQEVAGVGPRVSEEIVAFFAEERYRAVLDALLDGRVTLVEPGPPEPQDEAGEPPLAGKKMVFTGGLGELSRRQAKELAEGLGAKVTGSVSKATDYVVAGEDPGSKYDKAVALDIEILDADGFLALLAEHGVTP
ncbi:MAG: NAD-dependent DNA ligase LigA [Acidobacteriota bacterium]